MNVFLRILLGIFVSAGGFYMVFRTRVILTWFGRIPFAEQKFGPGGTITFYKLLGVVFAFVGLMIMTNFISGVLETFAGLFSP